MAEKKLEKGSDEWMFFQEYWKFRQKYYEADDEEKWFENLQKEVDVIFKKYKDTSIKEYVKELLVAHMNDVDRRYRIKNGKGR